MLKSAEAPSFGACMDGIALGVVIGRTCLVGGGLGFGTLSRKIIRALVSVRLHRASFGLGLPRLLSLLPQALGRMWVVHCLRCCFRGGVEKKNLTFQDEVFLLSFILFFYFRISRSILPIMSGLALYVLWIVIGYEQDFMDVDLV